MASSIEPNSMDLYFFEESVGAVKISHEKVSVHNRFELCRVFRIVYFSRWAIGIQLIRSD